jgi:MoxR-like ATPase
MTTPPAPKKSCLGCPSMLTQEESADFFNKSIGTPVCARFGKPTGRMDSSAREKDQIAEVMAANCPDHGKPRPATPDWSKAIFAVTFPDPKTIGQPQVTPQLVSTCAGCAFFVPPDVTAPEMGWGTGLCSRKGKLILGNRMVAEAKNCEYRTFGTPTRDTTGLTYLPEYEPNFAGPSDPYKAFVKAQENFVDPAEYPSDFPVTVEDSERGIRAWRRIADPLTGNEVMLPIFDPMFFSAEERKLIPRIGDDEHPEDYVDHNFYVYKVAVLWMELDETPAFWGQAGTGKTEFYRHMAYLMQVPFYRFSITGSTEVDELVGAMQYTEGKGTHFEEGLFVTAWKSACVMVVDELNLGKPDVQQVLRPCIDNSKQLVLTMAPGAPKVERSTDTYLGVAMNPAWDIVNYGAQPIGDADANRLMHLYIELPPESLERQIITKRCSHDGWDMPKEKLDMVMKIAKDIRKLADEGTLPITWAVRPQLKVARALRWFDPLTCYKMASADYLEPEQQEILLNVVRSHTEDVF